MSLYISTSCLKNEKNLLKLLKLYEDKGLTNVELGPTVNSSFDIKELAKLKNRFNFLVHAFFPPSEHSFVLNLASRNKEILKKSIKQAKDSIDFCHMFDIQLLSLHAGFRFDPKPKSLGEKIAYKGEITEHEEAFGIFLNSVKEMLDYTKGKNVKIAIENQVIAPFNLIDGKNELFMFCDSIDFERLFDEIKDSNLGMLLDLGHLKVSSNALDFDKDDFVNKFSEKTFEIHVHDNDGFKDEHKAVNKESWCLDVIRKRKLMNVPVVLESVFDNIDTLLDNIALIMSMIKLD